ncbi:hypothetical protein COLO4_16859 [Corchorus olitorius]|uniref:Uncharacterized protein n=1 Tax=Corchorus olitorius TaxID=93759 RepID=A0A1R3JF16_9ROSI|nr:hypothetical protein COLO4_16859 [Corchorus olitorius]
MYHLKADVGRHVAAGFGHQIAALMAEENELVDQHSD